LTNWKRELLSCLAIIDELAICPPPILLFKRQAFDERTDGLGVTDKSHEVSPAARFR
jgi:hypothetical protein